MRYLQFKIFSVKSSWNFPQLCMYPCFVFFVPANPPSSFYKICFITVTICFLHQTFWASGKKACVFSSTAESNLSEATGEFQPFERPKPACFSFLINKEKLLSLRRNASCHQLDTMKSCCSGARRVLCGSNLDQDLFVDLGTMIRTARKAERSCFESRCRFRERERAQKCPVPKTHSWRGTICGRARGTWVIL